jgi:hypothetical protein
MSDEDIDFVDDDLEAIRRYLRRITHHLEILMAGQASIDAAVAAITDAATKLQAAATAIAAELASGSTVTTTALDAALPALQAAVDAIQALTTPVVTGGNTITVTSPGAQTSAVSSGPVSLQIVATDSDPTQTVTFSATGLPNSLSISLGGLITGSPDTLAVNSVVVTASDNTGASGTASFSWTVTA